MTFVSYSPPFVVFLNRQPRLALFYSRLSLLLVYYFYYIRLLLSVSLPAAAAAVLYPSQTRHFHGPAKSIRLRCFCCCYAHFFTLLAITTYYRTRTQPKLLGCLCIGADTALAAAASLFFPFLSLARFRLIIWRAIFLSLLFSWLLQLQPRREMSSAVVVCAREVLVVGRLYLRLSVRT